MWTIRRLGWVVCLQPVLLSLVILSRREWAIGGVGIALGASALIANETIAALLRRRRPSAQFLARPDLPQRQGSIHSLLVTLYTLLPGLSRIPEGNPLPLPTDAIDDLRFTEAASYATPEAADAFDAFHTGTDDSEVVTPSGRGLLYPPELVASAPTVWLPRDPYGCAAREVEVLAAEGLEAVMDVDVHQRQRDASF